jgi:hypothetical protein
MREALLLCLAACSSQEAVPVPLAVVVDGTGLTPCTSDLGYLVEVTGLELAVRDLEFTVRGEMHEAKPHPGHAAGGEVTGELPGEFVLDFRDDGASIGAAILLEGDYHGANFTFVRGVDGHTFRITGTATKDARTLTFDALIDAPAMTRLVGAPFELDVAEGSTATLALQARTVDPFEDACLWSGVDFASDAEADDTVQIRPGEILHNILQRRLVSHDFYEVNVR